MVHRYFGVPAMKTRSKQYLCNYSECPEPSGKSRVCNERTIYTGQVGFVKDLPFKPLHPENYRPTYHLRSCPNGHIMRVLELLK